MKSHKKENPVTNVINFTIKKLGIKGVKALLLKSEEKYLKKELQ